ncbi:sugar-binding transcriptional regulator [Levilactobacillus bambusae]|uniref:RNA polymerase subunit sigma-70 n=1 Tax=Levilactobacillus bambusae TaxID=2024736 RepID=A0A2V1N200_9LACO|nr:sugar-binding transcriptional regulator [Levilactobacillus bambusae]PWG00355.1 RNA polymerase subunit sigma-70 [Levilactobacillus bambusae]
MDSTKRIQQALEASRYYYQDNYDQSKIARVMSLSRPTISRLLQFARDNGYVTIQINDPYADVTDLEAQLKQKYGLANVAIAYVPTGDYDHIIDKLGQAAADYLQRTVTDNTLIGVTWGKTMQQVAAHLDPAQNEQQGVKMVQLKGSVTHAQTSNFANEIINQFTQAFHAETEMLPLPVIFDNAKTHDLVLEDRHIQYIIDEGRRADVAIFTVGTVRDDALLFKLGYLNSDEILRLQRQAVGDINSRFITATGEIADEPINARTIGVDLNELQHKRDSILVAGGARKLAAIRGALAGHYATTLITDEKTAKALLAD